MHPSLRVRIIKSRRFAPVIGMALNFASLGNAWAAEAGGGHHLNWTDFAYRTVAFVILVAILVKLLRKPIVNFLNSRREEIQRLLSELEVKTAEAQAEHSRVQTKLATLEDDTRKIVDELIAEGEAERKKIIEAAHRQAEYIQQQAQLSIQQEVKLARDSLKDEMADLSVAAAEDLIKRKIRSDDQQRLVKEFMTKVVEAK